jgi:ornithine cyclodeaminase/alanine dehydrogenase-like protein (mu-crystallin family)
VTASSNLRFLSGTDVAAAMPPLTERLELARVVLSALGQSAELPPKIGVHPRPSGSLAHAMPALLRGAAADGGEDLIGVKWIAGFPENPSRGLPTYHALVILNDAETGRPTAIIDAGVITAHRTAAVSGAAIDLFGPRPGGRPPRVAVLGAGAQARSHVPVVAGLLPGAELRITDVDATRATSLAGDAATVEGIGEVRLAGNVREAVDGADVVLSLVSFGPDHQALDPAWLSPEALFVAVDYDMQAPAALARDAALFVVDEREQFLAARAGGGFSGYPDPRLTLGEALRSPLPRPAGRVLVTHLGVGLADVVFAAAILERAIQLGLGVALER